MVTVLVVDDSAFMRKALSMMLEKDPEVRVVDTARNGLEALRKVEKYDPDVVTMDVEMPIMDGLTALRQIMKRQPRPVLMISSLTREGAETTVEALQAGAVGFIPKQHSRVSLEITKIEVELIEKVKQVARSRFHLFRRPHSRQQPATPTRASAGTASLSAFRNAQLLAIGVSTGGPFALQQLIPRLPADLRVPVVVVQHMPPHFTRSLANRLDTMSALHVAEAEAGMPVEPGRVIIAAGGHHLGFRQRGDGIVVDTPDEPSDSLHRPSVDVMLDSAVDTFGSGVLAVIMTGMGKDGLEGVHRVRDRGGRVVAQDEATCVVYGMPRAVVEAGLADAVLPLDDLAPALATALGTAALASAT